MADQGRSDFCVVFAMSICALELKKNINKCAISTHTALNLRIHALRSYLKLTCECELLTLSNAKVSAAKDHGENYMRVKSAIFSVIVYS